MKKKSSFLVKAICLISILISLLVFVVLITNLEDTKVKSVSIEKSDIKGEAQEIVNPAKIEFYEVVCDEEDNNQQDEPKDIVVEETEKSEEIEKNTENYVENELNNENCEYSINSENDMLKIDKYYGLGDCIVIPNEIDGKKIEEVNTEDFSNSTNLETIKVSKEVATKIEEIPNFEINENLEEENYIVYTTTREYGEAYRGYLELSEDEREKIDFIPPKYEIPLEIKNENINLQSVGWFADSESYDLRDDITIKVENQNPYGICYAYAAFSAAETYWSLNHEETIDFSEVHGAVLTTGNGGNYDGTNTYFSSKLGPVYEEEIPVYEIRHGIFNNSSRFVSCLESSSPSSYSDVQTTAKSKKPAKYVTQTKTFPTITQAYKKDSSYDALIEEVRNDIKEHIVKYGALAAITNSNYMGEYNGKIVQNDQSSSSINHGVTIIGWDDNFDISNFPSSSRPKKNGAYLVLNSWGNGWGDNGCYWISYEDKWIEYWLVGVTEMTEVAENLQTSSIVVTDQETGNILDNANIEDGTKIKIELEATVTNEISGENVEVTLRDNTGDYTSYLTVTGTELVGKKANLEILLDTAQIKGNQYILEVSYGDDIVYKMIETPQEYCYSVNTDGTITLEEYLGTETEITVPAEYDGYKVSTIGTDAFSGAGLERVTIEEGITTLQEYAFRSNTKLVEVNLPRTLKTIGDAAFINCSKLEQLIIPRSVTKIGMGLVQRCTELKEVVIFKEATTIGGSMFYLTPSAVIYCEDESTALAYAKKYSFNYSIITENYNITYNENAGTDTITNMPSTQNKVKYDTIDLSSNIPVRAGYEFLGWATTASSEEIEYLPGDAYRTDSNLDLYAVWKGIEKEISFIVEYYKDNVKQDADTEQQKVTVDFNASNEITVDKSKINTKDKYLGYKFIKTEPAVIPDKVNAGDVIKVYYGIETYNISYDLNGGALVDGKANPTTYTVNDKFTLNNPEKEGYTFTGWTGSNGNTAQKTVTLDGMTGDKQYVANFVVTTYKLTYKIDGVQYGQTENYEYGATIVPKENPTRYGYKFSGWSGIPEKMPANDVEVTGTYTIDPNQTKELSYTVEYYKENIKQEADTQIEKITVQVLKPNTITVDKSKINTTSKYVGYCLEKTEPATIPDIVNNGDTIKVYYTVEPYKITYNLDGGTLESGKSNPTRYTVNDEFTLNNPEKEGYTFIGWTGSNGDVPEMTVTVEKGSTGDKNYVANYEINTYTIDYNLDGGALEYGKANPSTYTIKDTITLNNPEKEGYTFIGWTGSNGETPQKTVTIKKSTGNKNYVANYEINTYTLTYKVDGEQYGEIETYEYGEKIEPRENPEKYGYKFSGWSEIPETMPAQNVEVTGTFSIDESQIKELKYTIEYYKDNVKQDADTIEEKVTVQILEPDKLDVDKTKVNTENKYKGYKFEKTEPETIPDKINTGETIKIYYTLENYNISYNLNGGHLEEGKTNPETYTVYDEFALNNPEKEGYTFIGWTGSNGEEPQKTITIKDSTGNKNYVANYKINTYKLTIKYNHNSGNQYPKEYVEEYEFGKPYSIQSPIIPGYTCDTEVVSGTMGSIDKTVEVNYTANTDTKYVVEHYKQNIENDEFTLYETENKEGTTDTSTAAVSKDYEGFETQEFNQLNISGDESTVIKIYYNRNKYTLSYKLDGEQYGEIETYKYGQKVIAKENLEKYGYIFSGWDTIPETMPAKNVEVIGSFTIDKTKIKELNYTIEYYKDNVKQDTDTIEEKITVQILQPDTLDVDKTKINTENKYKGYKFEKTEPEIIPDKINTGEVIKVYYSIETYDLSYELNGGLLEEGKINPEKYNVNDEFTLNNPEKEGYTFIGWTGSNGEEPQKTVAIKDEIGNKNYVANYTINTYKLTINYIHNSDKYPKNYIEELEFGKTYNVISPVVPGYTCDTEVVTGTIGARDETIDVIYTANTDTKYVVEHYKQNLENEEFTLCDAEEKTGTTDTLTSAKSKGYEGFETPKITQEKISGDESTVIKIYYNRNKYTLSYKLDGEQYGEVETYKYGQNVVMKESPEKYGYKFSGWSESFDTMPAKNVEIIGNFSIDENLLKELSYTIEYYKDGVREDADTIEEKATVQILQPDTLNVDKTKINTKDKYLGYRFEKTDPSNVPEVINNGEVIKIYYVLENYNVTYDLDGGSLEEKTNPKNYTVNDKFTLNNPEKEGYTFIGWTGSNGEIPEMSVTVEKGTTGNKTYKANYIINTYTITYKVDGKQYGEVETYEYGKAIVPREIPEKEGYKFSGWTEIPEKMPAHNVEVEGTFSIDETKIKVLSYTVEYYKNNVKQEADTQVEKAMVQILQPDELAVDKAKINTANKYVGYSLEKTEPEEIPDVINNGEIIKIYYTANTNTRYIVEHYKQNIENDDYTLFETKEYTGTTDTLTQESAMNFEGFTANEFEQENIKGDGSTVLKIYYDRNKYKITYYAEPAGSIGYTYIIDEEYKYEQTIIPRPNLEEYGYKFSGWLEIPEKMPANNVEVYGSFTIDESQTKEISYTIEYYKKNVKQEEDTITEKNIVQVLQPDTITVDKTKINTENKYEGFVFEKIEPEIIPDVVNNGTIIKIYYSLEKYNITYDLDGGKIREGDNPEKYTREDEITLIAPEKEGYTFIGWTGSNGDIPEVNVKIDVGTTGDKEYKANYTINTYTIEYDLGGGILEEGKTNPETYTVHDEFTLNNPEKEGYTFIGWTGSNGEEPQKTVTVKDSIGNKNYVANYKVKTYKLTIAYVHNDGDKYPTEYVEEFEYGKDFEVVSPVIPGYMCDYEVVTGTMGKEDIYVDVYYTAKTDTKYFVEHYKQNIEDDDYTLSETEECVGTTDTNTVAVSKEYVGFTSKEVLQKNIEGDESTIVKIYYDRNKYTITYMIDGEKIGEIENYRYEEPIKPKQNPEKYGYKFGTWSGLPKTMPAENIEVIGNFVIDETQTKELSYSVEYYKNGKKQENDTEVEKSIVQVLEPDIVLVNKEKINTNDKYVGYSFEKTEPEEIPENIDNGSVVKVYYIPEIYTITYDLNGGELLNGNNFENYTIEDEITLIAPEKEGYTFIGWTGSNGDVPEETVTIEKGTTGNKTYKANYKVNTYTLTYKVDGEVYGEVESYEYGQRIIAKEEPTKLGYKFSGWSEIPETMPSKNVEVVGTFSIDESQIKELKYTVEYYKNNEKQEGDTEIEKITVFAFEEEKITVDKAKINTEDKYVGYSFEKTEPAEIPNEVNNGEVIKIYYTANTNTKYVVEHYKQNIENDDYALAETEECVGTTDAITEAKTKDYEGFTTKEFEQLNISGNEDTTIKIYYDRNEYTVTYKLDGVVDGEIEKYKYEQTIIPRENPEKYGYKFSGWTEIPETMPANNIEILGTFTKDETLVKELIYTVEYYKDGLKQDTDTEVEKVTVHILESDEVIVNKEKINVTNKYEGCVVDNVNTVIPDKVASGEIIKVYYVRKEAKVNIEYRDFVTGEEITEKVIKTAKVFDTYDITEDKKEIEGYTFIEGPEELTGEYTEEEQTKVYKYAKTSKVTVNYIDRNSNENLCESIIIDGYETKDYDTEEKEFENYILVEIEGNKSGKMTKEEITVNYYYISISQGVIEKHIDVITNEILDSKVHNGNEGDSYKIEAKSIEGYSLVKKKLPNNAEGKMIKDAIIVEYFYIRNTTLKVQYINKLTNEILYEEIREGSENEPYETKEKELNGYKVIEKPSNAYGKMAVTRDENNNIVTETVVKYYYKKVSKGVVVRHYDMQDYKLLKEESYSGLEGDAYKAEPKEFKGYNIVKEKLPTNAEGVMTIAEIEVNYFYKKGKTVTSEEYLINEDDIKKIVMETTITDFIENMNIREEYTILDQEGKVVSEDEIVKTGMKLKLESGKEYDLIVRGDINGDGKVSLIDLSKLILHYNGMKGFMLDGIPYKAADMNYDDKVSLIDVSQMLVFYNSI